MCACVAVQVHVPALVLPTSLRASSWPLPNRIRSQHQDVVPSVGLCRLPELRIKRPFFFGCAAWGDTSNYHTLSVWCGLRRGTGSLCSCLSAQGQPQPGLTMTSEHRPAPCQQVGTSATPVPTATGADHWQKDKTPRLPFLPLMVAHYEEPFAACTNNLRHCGSECLHSRQR